MINPIVSVIVPFYNSSPTLNRCVGSILKSTADIEVILVDDGSDDESAAYCLTKAWEDPRITCVECSHKGVSATRNAGMKITRGEYIGFADADDYIEPEMYSKMLYLLNLTGSSICVCGFRVHQEEKEVNHCADSVKTITLHEFKHAVAEQCSTGGYLFNKLYAKSLIADCLFDEELSICEDFSFNILITSSNVCRVVTCPEPLYHYVRHANSLTGGQQFFKNGTFIYRPAFDKLRSSVRDPSLNKCLIRKYFSIIRDSYMRLRRNNCKEPYQGDDANGQLKALLRELYRNLIPFLRSGMLLKALRALLQIRA